MKKLLLLALILISSSCFNKKIVGYQTHWKDLSDVRSTLMTFIQQESPFFTNALNDSLKVPKGYEKFNNKKFKWAILKVKFIGLHLTKKEYEDRTILMPSSEEWSEFFTDVTYVVFPIRSTFEKDIKRWYEQNQIIYVNKGNIIYLNQRPFIVYSNNILEENRKYSSKLISNWK